MLAMSTNDLALTEIWLSSDPDNARLRVDFPINNSVGAESTAVVYFEIEPGDYLPTHTDSAEEILYIVQGTARATVGDEEGIVRAGDLAVIPALVPQASPTSARTPSRSSASSATATSPRCSRTRSSRSARPTLRWGSPTRPPPKPASPAGIALIPAAAKESLADRPQLGVGGGRHQEHERNGREDGSHAHSVGSPACIT